MEQPDETTDNGTEPNPCLSSFSRLAEPPLFRLTFEPIVEQFDRKFNSLMQCI